MIPQSFTNQRMSPRMAKQPYEYISYSSQKLKNRGFLTDFSRNNNNASANDIKKRNKSLGRYDRTSSQQYIEQNKFTKKKSMNHGYVSHLFSVLRKNNIGNKGEDNSCEKSKQKMSTADLKQQMMKVTTTPSNQMAPNSILKSRTPKKRIAIFKVSKSKSKQKQKQKEESIIQTTACTQISSVIQVTSKHLKDYSKFIQSKSPYQTAISYKLLRQVEDADAVQLIDIKQYKVIEGINLCLIDSLSGDQPSSQILVVQYCQLYFQNEERKKFQVVANCHVFKTFSIKIKNIYAYERLWYYLVALLAENKIIFCEKVTQLCVKGLKLIDKHFKILFEAVSQNLNKAPNSILQAFKSLKSVKEIQSLITSFQNLFKQVQKLMSKQQQGIFTKSQKFHEQYSQILTAFKPFLSQSSVYGDRLQQFLCRAQIINSWKFLKIPPIPYLPQKLSSHKKYTIILGLNKVIILYNTTTRILKYRPYMDNFLSKLKQHFQIIIFSDFQKALTDRIIKQIQKQETFFSARLYRTHMSFKNGRIMKDIQKIGRHQRQTIILDNSLAYLGDYPDNQLAVPQFKPLNNNSSSLVKQKTLLTIMNKLLKLKDQYPQDIRLALKKSGQLYHIPEVATIQQRSIDASCNPNQ